MRNSPRIVAMMGESRQFFIIIEQKVLCEAVSFESALCLAFFSYYVFHLEYPKCIRNLLFFMQDYLLALPDSLGRSSTYLAISSDIKRNLK